MILEFSEPMHPASFRQGRGEGPEPVTTLDVRFTPGDPINQSESVDGAAIFGRITPQGKGLTYSYGPVFSFGNKKFEFTVQVFEGLTDLVGNRLANPGSFGPFRCDGSGTEVGRLLFEEFYATGDRDDDATTA